MLEYLLSLDLEKVTLHRLAIRKAMNSISDVKFVIFDISSEYGINILDLLKSLPSRIVLTESLPNYGKEESNYRKNSRRLLGETCSPRGTDGSKRGNY